MEKVCIITGASGGIGRFLCEGFYRKGYRVAALDIVEPCASSSEMLFLQTDLRREDQIAQAFLQIEQAYGTAHVLINNAAVSKLCKPITDLSTEELDHLLSVNLRASFLCVKHFIALNRGQGYGRILNIASTRWHQNEADWEAYGASKGGIVSLTNTLAVSLADTPITVNAVSPGWIETGDYLALSPQDHVQHPSGRVGIPRDVVNACLFLADQENDFINGHNLVVDGGMTKRMIYHE